MGSGRLTVRLARTLPRRRSSANPRGPGHGGRTRQPASGDGSFPEPGRTRTADVPGIAKAEKFTRFDGVDRVPVARRVPERRLFGESGRMAGRRQRTAVPAVASPREPTGPSEWPDGWRGKAGRRSRTGLTPPTTEGRPRPALRSAGATRLVSAAPDTASRTRRRAHETTAALSRYAHRLAGCEPPISVETVRVRLRGIHRALGAATAREATATAQRIEAMAALASADTLRGRALPLLGSTGAYRRSELAALRVGNLAAIPDGHTAGVLAGVPSGVCAMTAAKARRRPVINRAAGFSGSIADARTPTVQRGGTWVPGER
jgi:hypothetical protein